ncbi:MAG: c-type cytochrome, partial [Saprospiraceae bacterium]|nr:c-type cytochrome [Saprospiraceae bacterium]
GQTFDSWGHHFQTNNATHLHHAVMGASYMKRNDDLLIPGGQQYIPATGRGFDIFPITTNPTHQLLTDIGAMTSACGILWYQGDLFSPRYDRVVFTAEPVHNLIHADTIRDKGSTFESANLLTGREFLASTDSWFRPVNQYIGPDGAIYVLDYYRKIIEHPEWLSQDVIDSGDLYAGSDQGRIYRISPSGTPPVNFVDRIDMGNMGIDLLIEKLASENSWWRTHAQRLLMDSADPEIIPKLDEFILKTKSPLGKAHGLWLLEGKGGMNEAVLMAMLKDEAPGVRENAIKIAELHLARFPVLSDQLLKMVEDENPKVRYQLLLTLGEIANSSSSDARIKILLRDIEDTWIHYAALSAREINLRKVYESAATAFRNKQSDGTEALFKLLGETGARNGNSNKLNQFLEEILEDSKDRWFGAFVLEGMTKALEQQSGFTIHDQNIKMLTAVFAEETDPTYRSRSLALLHTAGYFVELNTLLTKAISVLKMPNSSEAMLADAIRVIGWTNPADHIDKLRSPLTDQTASPVVRSAVLEVLTDAPDKTATDILISVWPNLSPSERNMAVSIFLQNNARRLILLQAISQGQVHSTSLSWSQTVSLLNSADMEVRSLARIHLKGNELNADAVWNEYQRSLDLDGSSEKGATIFQQSCASCHQIRGMDGVAFGPDLAAIRNRNKASILLDILQPNKSIADGYELCMIESGGGKHYSGVIRNLSPNSVTVKEPAGSEVTLDRDEIKSLKFSEISAMPENLHTQLSVQEMADLLAYLKNG